MRGLTRWRWCAALVLAGVGLTVGCSEKKSDGASAESPAAQSAPAGQSAPAAGAISEDDRKQAEEIFSTRCTPCHGPRGMGNGPASAALTPPPRNFHDTTWQGAVTDEHIEQIIQFGGAAVGKSPAMPPNPDLVDKPVVKALRERIRSFGK